MTDRERLLRVFRQEPVDRVPVSPFIHINYIKEHYGSHDVDWVIKTPEIYKHFGFDIIHRNCSVGYDAFGPGGDGWEIEVKTRENGRDQTTETSIHTPGGDLRIMEELRWTYEYDCEVSVVRFPLQTEDDLELFIRYQPPLGTVDISDIQRAKSAVGDGGVIAPWIQGAFNLLGIYYRQLDDLLVDPLLRPDFYKRMMEHFQSRSRGFVQALIDAGADVLSYAGNIANGKLISGDFFRDYIWPYEKDLIDFIQKQGVAVLYHNCGYAGTLIPHYADLGLQAYESLTPPPYGNTVLSAAVENFGFKTTLAGGIDQLDLLRKGSKDEIETKVKEVMGTVKDRCHYIMGTTDYFNENTPADKISIFADAGRRFGRL
jgi:uroporphyrinogen decarboxylase